MSIEELSVLFRGLERLVIVAGAITSLYLGYRLFVSGFDSEQSAEASGRGFTIRLMKVGPGVFFALFGTIVMTSVVLANINVTQLSSEPYGNGKAGSGEVKLSMLGSAERNEIERLLQNVSINKEMFVADNMEKDAFLAVVSQMQRLLAKLHVGQEIFEKCQYSEESANSIDCKLYRELVR